KPEYGGHIQRLMGRISKKLRILPGTTKSNPIELGEYDPVSNAAMTFDELDAWLADSFVCEYHHTFHNGIGATPAERVIDGYLGENGIGIPPDYEDKEFLRLSLLPILNRKIE